MVGISPKKVGYLVVIALFSILSFINESGLSLAVDYEWIDAETLHFNNSEDDYYINMSSGIQLTNHYQDYWSRNIFCGGYYHANKFTPWLCLDSFEMD